MVSRAFFWLVACKTQLGTIVQTLETREVFLPAFILPASFLEQMHGGGEDAQGPSLGCCDV